MRPSAGELELSSAWGSSRFCDIGWSESPNPTSLGCTLRRVSSMLTVTSTACGGRGSFG